MFFQRHWEVDVLMKKTSLALLLALFALIAPANAVTLSLDVNITPTAAQAEINRQFEEIANKMSLNLAKLEIEKANINNWVGIFAIIATFVAIIAAIVGIVVPIILTNIKIKQAVR